MNWANNEYLYIRWAESDEGGSDAIAGVDNFTALALPATRLVSTTGTDSGSCISAACATIAYAIGQAIAGDTISVAAGTYTQSSITVDKSLTITGAGASTTIVQANASPGVATTRLFVVNSGVTATISGLTIRNGNIADDGGGILNHGDLTLNNSIVSGNRSNGSSNWGGGGIANGTLGAATLTLNNTTVSGNASINSFSGGMAGGIWHASGTMTINSSTISGNTADIDGGGVYNGFLNAASLTINNSTISGNSAINNGGGIYTDATVAVAVNYSTIANNTGDSDNNATGDGGGAYRGGSGAFSLKSSIIAGNKRGTNTTALGVDCAGSSFTSAGYNLSGASTGCPSGGTGDATVVPATVFTQLLGPLASNGGNTQTHALLATATPALNQIASGTNQCGTAPFNVDQRGSVRPSGGTCDKGAYELLVSPPSLQKLFQNSSMIIGSQQQMTISVSNPNSGTTLTGVAWSDTLPTGLSTNGDSGPDSVCGGSFTKSGATITLTGASIAPLDTCAISFAVIANGAATGLITNTTNAVTSTNGGTGNTGSANVTVTYPKKFRSLSVLGGGNWNSTATWEQSTDNGSTWQAATTTPTSADGTVEIGNHLVIVTANVTVDEVTGAAGGSIQINSGVTLTVADGAGTDLTIGNSGQLDLFGSGALLNNGQVQIDGQLTRFSSSSSVTGAPSYGSSAIIYYAASGINRTDEWLPNVTSGAGYPKHVTLQSGSFNLPNGVTNQPFQMGGDLTVTGGFSMGAMTSPLTVVGNVHVNPGASNNLQLSTAAGGDLNVGGNFTVVGTGSLTPNGRTVAFNGTGNQIVSTGGTGTGHTFAGFTVNKASGNATLAGDLSASTLNVTAGTFDQGATFSVSSGAATVGGSGVWTNNGTGDLTLSGNVSNAGSIAFDGGGPGACGADSIAISSSVNGTQRAWSGAGTFSMTDVDVRDQAGSATIIVLSGTNNLPTNGANWLFVPVCSSGSYTWTGTVSTDWAIAGNWTPTRTAPGTSDVLYIDGSVTPAPTITNVGGASGETVAALNLTAGTQPNLSASTSAKTVTLAGTSGAALNIDSTSIMTLSGSTALTISVATGSTASIGGGVILGGGAHRLIGADANAVTFASGGFCTTTTGFSGNAFGDGSTGNGGAGSVIFQSGANYFHSAGSSPFGNASNAAVAVFQTGSTARFFTASGFESGGRTYADLAIGRTDPGGVAVAASGSGTGDFQFDNLSINSPVGSNSSLTHNGSGASLVRIRGNITSNGAGSGTLPDVTITAGSNNIVIGKVGGGTITFGNDGSNTRGVQFENNTTVATGTTLALNRVVLLGLSQPNTKIFQINAANGLTGGASGYVIGNVRQFFLSAGTDTRTFNVGTVNGYSPVDTTMTVTDAGMNSLTVGAVQAIQPNISGANAISRYWKLASSFVGTGSADLTFNYLQGDVAPATEANLRLFKYDGSFTQVAATYDNNTNTATATGISSFSDWTLAEPSAVPQPPTVTTDAGSKLFIARYITADAIARVNVDGTGLSANHFAIPSSAIGVTVDTVNGKLYWSTLAGGGSVGRMNLDGSGVEPNFLPGVYTIGMAVDTVNGWLYMTGGAIKRVRLDGTGFETLIPGLDIPAVTSCSGIALDVPNNKLYYAFNTNIGRANLDGTGHNPTYIATGSGAAADDVAIDRVNNKLYWTVSGGNKIGRANVDGTGINGAFMSVTAPRSLIIDPQAAKIFWSDGSGVGRSDLDGTGANPSFITVSGSWGIAVGDVDVEGTQAVRTGTYSDPNGDAVTISVSAGPGSVTQTGTSSGSWTWTYTPPDGPANPNVTITATDSTSLTSSTNFTLNVNNVAPTIALTGNSNVTVSTAYSLDLGAITDPGTDTVTGYSINWGDGNTETFAPDPPTGDTRTHTYATTGSKTISVSLTDEDGTHLNAGVKTVVVDPPPAETSIAVSGGNLTITDDNGGNSNDNLTITCTPPNIIINDPGNTLSAGPGATQVDPNTVSVPIASITGSITINTLGGNDSLTLNLSGCDLIPVGGLSFNGGENTGDDDGMSIVGGNQGTVTYGYGPTNGDGTVAMSNYGTITYTGLEPISNTGTATDVIFNLPAGPTNAVTLLDIGGGNSRLSGATFEQTDFANPTGSATINRGNAADTVDVNALATNYPSLTIGSAGGGEFAAIDFNGAVTFGSDKNLSGFATGTISFTDPTSDLATSGTGTIALTTATNVTMLSGSSLTTVNGSLTINANQQALPTTTAGIGINMNNATIHSTGTGVVVVNARGGTGPGIAMDNGSIIRGGSTSGSNTTIVNGMGGTGGNVHGMQIGGGPTSVTGSKITSIGGNISVTGTGGAGGGTSHGIILYPSGGSAGTITGPANASVVVTGTGGTGGGNNIGVLIDGLFSRIGTSGTGTVSVTGTGVGASDGVQLSRDGVVTTPTGAGAVTITGTMGTSGFGIHMNSNGNSTIGSSPHGTVNLIADTMHLSAGFVDTNGAGTVNIRQKTNNQPIGLGAADSASLLGLTDAELNRVIAGTLTIGNGNSGAITTSGAVPINLTDAPAIPNLNLVTSANLVGNISGNDIFVSTLNITAPTGIGALGNSLDIDVTTLTTNTSGSNGDQHIVEQNTATVGTGDMNAGSGTLRLVGRFNTASGGDMLSDVLVRGGGILGGVGAVSTTELTTVESGGAISPGTSPGILSTGPVTFNSGSTFNVELNGTTPGTGHDQLNATGNVALGNATLSLSSTFSPTVGQTFVIINNVNSGDDTTGTFNGIADGSTISNVFANGYDATINYNGGVDGNDVVLTAVAPPSDVVVSAASLPDFGSVTVGNYSAAQTYNVSGTFLTANIVVTAPANFEVSLSPTSGFGSSVSIAPTSGTVTATPIYVRFAPGAAGALGGNVLNASTGATTENVAVTGTGIAAVCTAPPANMVAWYSAEGDANDRFGVNNGTLQNGAGFAAGKVGQAFSLDGSNDFVDVGDLDLPSNFTIDAWVNPTSLSNNPYIFSKDNGVVGNRSYYFAIEPAGTLVASVGNTVGGFTQYRTNSPVIVTSTWQHVAVAYDGAAGANSKMLFYVNGVVAPAASLGGLDNGGTPLNSAVSGKIGIFGDGASGVFGGLIDEVELFGRTLSGTEIANIYNASTAGKCLAPEIVVEEPINTGLTDNISTSNFGSSIVSTSGQTNTFTVRNTGTTTLNITVGSITIDGANPGDFVLNTGGMSPTVSPGGNTAFTVQFMPSAGGVRSANLHIPSDDADEDPFDVALTGTGLVPGTLSFKTAPYTDGETNADHAFTVTVQRTIGSDGIVGVTYATSAGTATAGTDYTETTNTLSWGNGDTADKTFNITVKGDTVYEANETVNLTLSAATGGASIGAPNPTTLTITNDDPPPTSLVVNATGDTDDAFCLPLASGNNCTLREAVNAANLNVDANTITFNIPAADPGCTGPACTITLGGTQLTLANNVSIDGAGPNTITVSGNNASRVFQVNSGISATINGLTISGGNASSGGGAGILNSGTLSVTGSTLSNNSCAAGNLGGGIYGASGSLTVASSTISGNSAGGGGGGIWTDGGTLSITNTTISNNVTPESGGGLTVLAGTATLINTTITNNRSNTGGSGGPGGGITNFGTMTLHNTIVVGNFNGSGSTAGNFPYTAAASSSNNLLGQGGAGSLTNGVNGNQIILDSAALLGPLASNGGPTQTHALLAGSLAIDTGNSCVLTLNGCAGGNPVVASDQRGTTRPRGLGVDIGAFEVVDCVPQPANMVAWYSGENHFNDIQGPTFESGAASGTVGFTAGKVGQAFNFTASGFANMGTPAPLVITGNQITLDGWVKPTAVSDAVYFGRSAGGANDYLLLNQFGGLLSAIIKTNTGETIVNAPGPPVGQWSHIALTYDGSMMRLYMNGVEVGSTPKTGNITNSGQPFGIGGRTSGLRFNGAVDEVEVFNRALSAAEIANIYGADTFGKCKYGLIEFTSPTYTVGEAGTNASITVRRTDGSKGAVSATFNTSDGTATTAGLDYTTTSTTVNFANGDTADKTVLVPINDDMIDEADETVNAALTSPSGGAFVGPQGAGVLTITDNDAASASIGNVTQVELNSSTSSFAFPVSLSLQRSTPTTINYSMADGSATGGSDFVSVSGSITIPALTTIGTINVTVNGDTTYEANETFTVTITSPDVGIGTGTGTGTITNDDAVPATVVVNTTADTDDGFCLPLGQGNGCSLREAIDDANQNADATTINFGIPNTDPGFAGGVYTIRPTGALSQVSTAMTIDGTTQTAFNGDTNPNGPEVVVNGSLSGGGLTAFHLTGSAVKIVKGLVINAYGAAFGGVASNYQILDNYVGTNAAGTAAVANNGGLGLGAGSGNTISGNLISGNTAYGISTCDVTNSTFSNNKIGTDRTGTANVGNGAEGFSINCTNGNNNTISGNTIAFNGTDGLRDAPDYPTTQHFNNRFTQNSIFSNGEQGIDLWPGPGDGNNDGVTPNDNMDPDAGANNLQNFPVITSAYVSGSTKAIRGTLNTNPNSIAGYTIEFFANAACDSVGGNGEGQTYLGAITTSVTDASGNVTPFVFNPAVLTVGQFITATATDSAGNTSEFSACTQVVTGTAGTIEFALDPYSVAENAGPAVITVTRVGGTQGAITATFDTSNGTATAGSDYTAVNGVVFSYADGETGNKTVNVPLLDDGIFELDETVNLSLSNTTVTLPNGETFMAPSADTAILTITNDEACVPNPVVTINADSGVTSLRQAVLEACAGSTITFAPGPVPGEESPEAPSVTSPISLSGGQIVIDKNVTIQGPGASVLTVQNTQAAGPTSRIFLINSGVTATISGLTLTGGNTTTADGGAVNNAGVLTLTNMVITANTGGSTVANGGGGISNTGTLNLNSSTISNNVSGGGGGGLLMVNGGTANISGSTFSGNTSTGGSAVLSQAITIPANLSVTNLTISGNTGTPCPGIWNLSNGATATATVTSSTVTNNSGAGGGICAAGPTTVRSSIVAAHQNNTVNADVTGAFTSQGFNLIGNVGVATGFTQPTDQTGTGASPLDPMLAALANNGGPTQTHALNPASPAADKGIDAVVPLVTDQRGAGFGRTVNNPAIPPAAGGDNTDIGAFEIQNTPPTISAVAATRQEGSPVSNSTIANVTDAESGNGGVVVTVTSANPSNGVTISNIVNTSGVITADVVAACGATTATFTLTATDGGSLTATATLTVTVTANTQPVLTYNNPPAIVFGAGTVVNPATGPSDNGSVTSTVLQSAGTYTGTISVHPTNGTVTISNAAPVGTHTITIRATDNCGAFTDSTFQLTVNKADTTTALTSNANPSVFGQPVTFTATISVTAPGAGTPTGTVTFKDNGVNIGTCAAQPVAASVATCTISTLSVGTHPITAVYNGDGSFNASTSNTVNQVVGKADTTTTVTASPVSPSVFGQSVTFTATVAVIPPGAGSPTGTVSFNIDGNIYCANTPINGSFQATCTQAGLPALPAGVRNVVAIYNGDANFNGSAGTLNYTVNKANTATAILNDTPDPSLVNQPYTVTWTVTAVAPGAGTPTGTVTVNGGTGGGTCTASVAAGGCQLTPTTIGVKTISATYNGDANFNTSTSATASHTVHLQISGTVVQAPAMTPLSGVTITLSGCASQTTTTDAAGNYAFAGAYTGNCTVAPSGLGKIYDPISRTYTAITNNVAGANFTAYNSAADVPRTLTMVNQYVVPGAAGSMPVVLNSQDNESSVAFSFSYDINPFSQPPTAVCGANAPGCTLTLDTSVFGRVGVTVVPAGGAFTRPDGTPLEGPEAAGPKEVARINFQTVATATVPSTPLTFVSTPTPPLTLDAANNPLLTTYVSGLVVFAHGIEGDVAARNAGSGLVDSSDVVQLRRFVTGLDTPVVTHNEFQRADTAPSSTKGNGVLDATDVIQTRRYATGLDGPVSAGGPGQAIAAPMPPPVTELANAVRELKAGKVYGSTGSRVVLPVEMRAAGDEAAISFTVRYDHTRLGDPSVELAGTADGLTLTANTEEPGVIRVLVDANSPFGRSSRDASLLVNVSFDVVTKAPTGETAVTIEDLVVSDSNARSQPVRSAAGSVSISGPNAAAVSISGRVVTAEGAGLRNATVTITDAAGQSRTVTTGTFGYYRFDGVAAGGEYTLAVSSRRYRFAPRRVVPGSDLAEVNFTAQE